MPLDPIPTTHALDQAFRADCARLDSDSPWFGTFTADLGGRVVEYRVGDETSVDDKIFGWLHALGEVYYDYRPGDEFELERPYKEIVGTMVLRGHLVASGRALVRAELADADSSAKVVSVGGEFVLEREASPEPSVEGLPDIRALLTPEQYRLIKSSRRRPVVIQGRAGSGKTTVALYRVAWLAHPGREPDEAPVAPSNVLIVMFNKALQKFVAESLQPLRLEAARLDTFHGWALDELRRAYKGEIEIDTEPREGSKVAERLKKQMGMLAAIDEFVAQQEKRIDSWLEAKLEPYDAGDLLAAFRSDDRPIARRLIALRTRALQQRNTATGNDARRHEQIYKVFQRAVTRTIEYKEELLRFLGDTELLSRHLPEATSAELDALATFQREVQSVGSSERRAGPYIRFEDLALLLWLIQRKHGGFPNKLRDDEVRVYDHLVIDEAQDFGAVDLNVLLSSVRSRTGVTIVGDTNQKIVPDADFLGWDRLIAALGASGAEVAALEVAHRSTRPIMALTDALVGDETALGRAGPKPRYTRVADQTALAQTVAQRVGKSLDEGEHRHVCVVLRHQAAVGPFAAALRQHLPVERESLVRVGHNKNFRFDPGVTVTNMRQIKGLEFDTVIAVEPNAAAYPDDDQGRRWLYTVLTRAKESLELVGTDDPTPLLQHALDSHLLETEDQTPIPEVEFDDTDTDPF
jgi:DNA helicase II / ATP-dependent DNA helicase PcrA